jgi:hypothetical protein
LTSVLAAHSERKTLPSANPVTRTVTLWPARSPPEGVTVTVGWLHARPGTPDGVQVSGLVPATVLALGEVAGLTEVAVFAPVPAAGADDRPPHEAASTDKIKMTAAKTPPRPSM